MQKTELTGKIFDIKGFSVHDGPGIRTTVFLKGCPLRCLWCHSPESQGFSTELNRMEKKCIGIEKCGRCIAACPQNAISPSKKKIEKLDATAIYADNKIISADNKKQSADNKQQSADKQRKTEQKPISTNTESSLPNSEFQIPNSESPHVTVDRSKCDNCGKCAKACTSGALFMCGTDYTVDKLVERILRDVPFFNRSGGGVTLSGGECLCQPEFTLEVLKRCKGKSIHTAVDTSGFVRWEVIESVLPYTDIFLYDIKGIDARLHEQAVGAPNGLILENARKIAEAGGRLLIRIPVIPGYNDSVQAINDIGEFIVELGSAVEAVQILPYHKLGIVKWERLEKGKPIFEAAPPSGKLINARINQLESMGLAVLV